MTSREVQSSQSDVHSNLDEVVRKHLSTEFRKPISEHTRKVFDDLQPQLSSGKSLILDSGCGTGESSCLIALNNPDSFVLGIDKSIKRLERRQGELPENCMITRAECADFWRLCAGADIVFDQHFLLYPNPWPKPEQLMRRWHGHPVFPSLLKVSRKISLRSNWRVYVDEFARALEVAGCGDVRRQELDVNEALSPFEKKYSQSKHSLYEVLVEIGGR